MTMIAAKFASGRSLTRQSRAKVVPLAFIALAAILACNPALAFEPGQPDQRPANIYDSRGNYQGQVKPEGTAGSANVYDSKGNFVGNVDAQGKLRDKKGRYVGQVRRP